MRIAIYACAFFFCLMMAATVFAVYFGDWIQAAVFVGFGNIFLQLKNEAQKL